MVSIIMPAYNRAYIIGRAVQSVMNQTYEDWELIIVDDASEDNTEETVRKYDAANIRYYRNRRNLGANPSRNIGAGYAQGDVLAFLDSDNYWPEDRLELQMGIMEQNWDKRCFLYGQARIKDGETVKVFPGRVYPHEELKRKLMLGNVLDLNTLLMKKEIFEAAGGFDESIGRFQDWELVLRLMYCFDVEAVGCERVFSYNEVQQNSIGRNANYIEACGKILKKHMCSRLPEKDMLDYLLGIWAAGREDKEAAWKEIREIGEADSRLLPEAVYLLANLQDELQAMQEKLRVSNRMENLLYEWHRKNLAAQEGTLFSQYFHSGSSIRRIAVYGFGKLGKIFLDEIRGLPVEVAYLIDRKVQNFKGLPVRKPEDRLEPVDLIVVAVLDKADGIRDALSRKYSGRIVTLTELVKGGKDEAKDS